MLKIPADSKSALRHTCILFAAALVMLFLWAYLRLPDGNLLIITFTFLAASGCADLPSAESQTREIVRMTFCVIILQFTVSATAHVQLLNMLLPPLTGSVILKILPTASAYPVMLSGFMAYPAASGIQAAAGRAADLLIAGAPALFISYSASRFQTPPSVLNRARHLPDHEVVTTTLAILAATFLYKFLSMPQGIWIILTVIFICMAQQPGERSIELVQQRIFSVPAGIILGGIYSGSAVMFNYHMVYLAPLIGAVGFFSLYYRHNFGEFSLYFMFAFTICADWLGGYRHGFHFWQLLAARSLATLIGAAVLLSAEKIFSYSPSGKSAP